MGVLRNKKWLLISVFMILIKDILGEITVLVPKEKFYVSIGQNISVTFNLKSTEDTLSYPKTIDIDVRPIGDVNLIHVLLSITFKGDKSTVQTFTKKNNSVVPAYAGRISATGSKFNVNFELSNIKDSDFQRVYRCTVKYDDFNTPFNGFELLRAVPPTIMETSFFPKATAIRNSNREYICRAGAGNPVPLVSWSYRSTGEQISSGQGYAVLKIINARIIDSEIYICRASNNGGTVEKKMILTVAHIESSDNSFYQQKKLAEGDMLSDYCNIDGYPVPDYRWYNPQNKVIYSEKKLAYGNMRNEDFGNFTCVANNTAGTIKFVLDVRKSAKLITRAPESRIGRGSCVQNSLLVVIFLNFVYFCVL